jgi:hypothetical protein
MDHWINFHELMKDPSVTLLKAVTVDNIWSLQPLTNFLSVHFDDLLVHLMTDRMDSSRFDDYADFIARLNRKTNLEAFSETLSPRLRPADQAAFFESIGLMDQKRRRSLAYDLNTQGLSEFVTEPFFKDPSKLICELYGRLSLQETFGKRLYEIAAHIAWLYDLSIKELEENFVNNSLLDIEKKEVIETTSIFCETYEAAIQKEENINIQKALFILRAWERPVVTRWLLRFIYQPETVPCRSKAKAFTCLFALTDETEIVGDLEDLLELHRKVYFGSRLEYFKMTFNLQDLSKERASATVGNLLAKSSTLPPGIFRVLFEFCLDAQFSERCCLLEILNCLKQTRKRYLLRNITKMFHIFPQYALDAEFQAIYREIVSHPIDCFIAKHPDTLPIKPHHISVVRDLLDALAAEPFEVRAWRIGGVDVEWPELVRLLCDSGFVPLAAELGGMVVEAGLRATVLRQLMESRHFDEAIRFGFDRQKVFDYILEIGHLQHATEIFIDQHLDWFVEWLVDKRDVQALDHVRATLRNQGRTKEANRIAERARAIG